MTQTGSQVEKIIMSVKAICETSTCPFHLRVKRSQVAVPDSKHIWKFKARVAATQFPHQFQA